MAKATQLKWRRYVYDPECFGLEQITDIPNFPSLLIRLDM